ncbi:MAG: hypothetical protein DWG83_01400 [Chloroflexi bacterium]|nr:ABC transporter substrate-binding protein [Chloroflexota bacterium]MDA1240269.1 ABC transporter substrate-binding protein [Chloroflexota bacterium]MQC19211.1 hypothetical protein [Chloroflexota bacterium]
MPPVRRGPITFLLLIGIPLIVLGWVQAGSGSPAAEGRYVEAVIGVPVRVSPLAARTTDAEADLVALVFAGLMRLGPDGRPLPALAESWELTPDALTYTFHLRPDLSWHDGVAVDAYDVAFTIDRIQDPAFRGSAALAADWVDVQVFVADALTVLIRLPEPAADFLSRAALGLVPRHLAARMDPPAGFDVSPFEREPVGAGPYRLVSLDGEGAVLERHPNYALGTPSIRRIELRFAEDALEQAAWLRDRRVDAALFPEQPTEVEAEALERRDDLATTALQRNAATILYFNNIRGPLANAPLRRAVAATLEPSALIEAADGARLRPAAGVIPIGTWAHVTPDSDVPATEPLWAAALVERGPDGTRTRGGRPLVFSLVTNADPQREALAAVIASALLAEGIAVEVTVVPAQRVISEYLRTADFDLVLFGWEYAPDPDPYTGWHTSQVGGAGGNVATFSDPEADALLEAARTTMDIAERRDLYALFARRFEEQGASLVVGHPERPYAHPSTLRGLAPGLLFTSGSRFASVHLWTLAE